MAADDDVNASLNGVVGGSNNVPLNWRWAPGRGRVILSAILHKAPFNWPVKTTPQTTSTYDQVQLAAEQAGGRYVDTYGLVWDETATRLVFIEWLLDGAPTNLTANAMAQKIAKYRANADQLRPWPTGFAGAFQGEPQQTYPPFPPAAS
jgi:hypothetical protein